MWMRLFCPLRAAHAVAFELRSRRRYDLQLSAVRGWLPR